MDKLEIFKAMLPFIPLRYRRPLLLFIHIDELMRIINSMNECLKMPINAMDTSPPDMSKMFDILKQNMSNDESDMMSMLLPLLMSGGMSGGDGLSSIISGLSGFNIGNKDKKKSDDQNTDSENMDNESTDNDFSDEIDNLFKDFIDETRNDNYE